MPTYSDVVKRFENNGCKLHMTEDEYNDIPGSKFKHIVSFTSSCGHENTVTLTNFIYKGSGIICKNCTYANITEKLKTKYADNATISLEIEQQGFKILENLLSEDFDIQKTNEGCLADIIIKPKYEDSDKWCLIQLKTTKDICHDLYTFSFHNRNYENCCVICICIEDEKMWMIDYTLGIGMLKLNFGKTSRSEYYRFMVSQDMLAEKLHNWYAVNKKFNVEYAMQPITPLQQKEQEFRRHRETMLPFLQFDYPEIQGLKTDFYINDFKIQEKIASKVASKENSYVAHIRRTIRTNTGKQGKKSYAKGDNDFYWIWKPDNRKIFYLFPEQKLIEKDLVGSTKRALVITKNNWTKEYCFNLDDANLKEKLLKIFG